MSSTLVKIYNSTIDRIGGFIGSIAKKRLDKKSLYFPYLSEILSQVPFVFGWKLRRAAYARILPQIGEDVILNHGVSIEDARTSFGSDIWISVGSYVDYVIFEDHVLVGQNVILLSDKKSHNFDRTDIPIKLQGNPNYQSLSDAGLGSELMQPLWQMSDTMPSSGQVRF